MKQYFLFLIMVFGMLLTSCEDKPVASDTKIERDPKGSVYFDITESHIAGNKDVITITRTYHNASGIVVTTKFTPDTIESLPLVKDTIYTGTTHENSDGDEVDDFNTLVHPKDYQLYITVKSTQYEKK